MSGINNKVNAIAVKYFNGNNSAFAKAMDTSEANIRNYRNGITPKLDFVIKLSEVLEISFDNLLSDEVSIENQVVAEPNSVYNLKTDKNISSQRVPLYDIEATAGVVELFKDSKPKSKPIDFISIPNLPKCDGAIHVTGDSMYPLLKSGDIIMYKKLENSINSIIYGEMYLLSIDLGGEEYISVKWIQRSEKGEEYIKIVSQNAHHQPKDVHLSKVKALALIKASIRINSMV